MSTCDNPLTHATCVLVPNLRVKKNVASRVKGVLLVLVMLILQISISENTRPCPKAIKSFSCSLQLSVKFQLLIKIKVL